MTKQKFFLFLAIAIIVLVIVLLESWPSAPVQQAQKPLLPPPSSIPSPPLPLPVVDVGAPISLKTMSKQQALQLYVERARKDEAYDWKQPINFYGKVVDENNQPVIDATARLGWTTIGTSGNYAKSEVLSDTNGLFSLTGQHGKILQIRVEKEGYYTVDGGKGSISFEYADPSNPEWYEPDSNKPVVFHLRKKGVGAKLFSKRLIMSFNVAHPQKQIDLTQGSIKPDGGLTITSDTSKFLPGAQAFPWTVTFTMSEGGLVETNEQFPFLAPENGYVPTLTIDMSNLDRNVWRGDVTKTYYFYLPSSNTYGRLTVVASSSLPLTLDIAYNVVPGNRVLEPSSR